jgi:hypothetical protein
MENPNKPVVLRLPAWAVDLTVEALDAQAEAVAKRAEVEVDPGLLGRSVDMLKIADLIRAARGRKDGA